MKIKLENMVVALWQKYTLFSVSLITIVVTAVMMFTYTPLCAPGDFYVHFNRIFVLMDALKDGSFPYYMDYYGIEGYGYLIKAFYSDFLLIPFALLGNLISGPRAYVVLIFLSTFLCSIWMFLAMNRITKKSYLALLIAMLYTFCTYRVFDIYIRGALGEVLSFTCLPLIIWGGYEILKGEYKKWYIFSIGISLLIYCHLISTVLTACLSMVFFLMNIKTFWLDKRRLKYLFISLIACIPLTAYYIFPMLELMQSNDFYYSTKKLVDGIIGFKMNEMISGIFNSVSLRNEDLFPKLGGILTAFIFLRLFVREKSELLKYADICSVIGVIIFFMTFPQFPWHIPPFSFLEVIQFSWRLLEYSSLLFAISGGIYAYLLIKTRTQKILLIVVLSLAYFLIFNSDSIHYRTLICYSGKPSIGYDTSFRGFVGGEYLPARLPSNNFEYKNPGVYNDYLHERGKVILWNDSLNQVQDFFKDKGNIKFKAIVQKEDKFELPLTYYIGYNVLKNGEKISYQQSENGLMEIPLTESASIEISYVGTSIQRASFYITLISILLLIVYILYDRKTRSKS